MWNLPDEMQGLFNEICGINGKNTRYKEHMYNIKSNNSNTGYSKHALDTGHAYGTMNVVRIGRKEQYLNTIEKHYIYKIRKEKLHMNDSNNDEDNPIFEELQKIYDASDSQTTHPSPPTQSQNV
jgi:hypothetical protein